MFLNLSQCLQTSALTNNMIVPAAGDDDIMAETGKTSKEPEYYELNDKQNSLLPSNMHTTQHLMQQLPEVLCMLCDLQSSLIWKEAVMECLE